MKVFGVLLTTLVMFGSFGLIAAWLACGDTRTVAQSEDRVKSITFVSNPRMAMLAESARGTIHLRTLVMLGNLVRDCTYVPYLNMSDPKGELLWSDCFELVFIASGTLYMNEYERTLRMSPGQYTVEMGFMEQGCVVINNVRDVYVD